MKNLLNNISQEEKNRILEMHSGKKNVIKEDDSLGSNKKVLTLSKAWDFYLDAHFQHVLDEVIGELTGFKTISNDNQSQQNQIEQTLGQKHILHSGSEVRLHLV